jgi:hypothetical protein
MNSIAVYPVSTLIGNKIDREDREIPTHVGEDFAQRHSMYYVETSAKEAENVERLFMEIAVELMEVNISYICKVLSMTLIYIYFFNSFVSNQNYSDSIS